LSQEQTASDIIPSRASLVFIVDKPGDPPGNCLNQPSATREVARERDQIRRPLRSRVCAHVGAGQAGASTLFSD
jgi:hypothetical protein